MMNDKQYEELQMTVKNLRETYESEQNKNNSDPIIKDKIDKLNKIIDELNKPQVSSKKALIQDQNQADRTVVNTVDYISNSGTVQKNVAELIHERLQMKSVFRKLAKIAETKGESYDVAIYSVPMSAVWSEGSAVANVVNSFIMEQVKIFDINLQPKATQRLLNDVDGNFDEWLSEQVSSALLVAENNSFINGDGINQPKGLFSTTQVAGQIIEKIQTTTVATVKVEDIMKLYYALGDQYEGAFFMNSSTTQAIRTLKDSSTGQYLWSPGLLAGKDDTLLGKPLYNINTIPNMVAGNRIVAYADLNSCYQIVDRKGVNVQEDPYTNKPYVIFSVTKGVGGAITDPNGIKILAC